MILSDKFKINTVFKCTVKRLSKKQLMIHADYYGVKKFKMWFWTKNKIREHILNTIKGGKNATT